MPSKIDKLIRRRAMLMMFLASTYLIWQVPSMDWIKSIEDGPRRISDHIADFGQLAWAVGLLCLIFVFRRSLTRASSEDKIAMEDELVQSNRLKAMRVGYLALIAVATILFIVTRFKIASADDIARTMLAVGVAAPLYAFAFLELKDA